MNADEIKITIDEAVRFATIMLDWDKAHPLYHIVKQASHNITELLNVIAAQQADIARLTAEAAEASAEAQQLRAEVETFKAKRAESRVLVELVSAPEDYNHPSYDRRFEVGDRVLAREGLATVTEVFDDYENRAGERVAKRNYHIKLDDGTEAQRFGYELNRVGPTDDGDDLPF